MLARLRLRLYKRLLERSLIGRNRSRARPERGRFTAGDVARVMARTAELADALAARVPRQPTAGARMMVTNGVQSLALYRALRGLDVEPPWAIELCTDFLWAAYRRQLAPIRWLAHRAARTPEARMAWIQRRLLRFPLASPGYECRVVDVPGCFAYDVTRCPVRDFFAGQDPEAQEFFRSSWCTLDWPLAEYLVPGGTYERRHTLSAGDAVCDMRWGTRAE